MGPRRLSVGWRAAPGSTRLAGRRQSGRPIPTRPRAPPRAGGTPPEKAQGDGLRPAGSTASAEAGSKIPSSSAGMRSEGAVFSGGGLPGFFCRGHARRAAAPVMGAWKPSPASNSFLAPRFGRQSCGAGPKPDKRRKGHTQNQTLLAAACLLLAVLAAGGGL
eukprot:scaffold12766_cov117-Isochrysis_galbana.AAC.1